MNCLPTLAAFLSLVISAEPSSIEAEVDQQQYQQYVPVDRPDGSRLFVPASDQVLARDVLRGTWQVVSLEHQGHELPDLAVDLQMKFTRGRLELLQYGREPVVLAYQLDLGNSPAGFTWILRPNGQVWQQKGVCWTDGEKLMICVAAVNQRRANDFLTQPCDGRTLYVLERAEPAVAGE